jgi:NADH:ubiquinone oxidoreductase subunit K
VFVVHRKHVLNSIIVLEYLVIVVALGLVRLLVSSNKPVIILLSILAITATSASLGLSLLVGLCRTHGKDLVNTSSML